MTNAEKFKNVFGLYATELWSMPEKEFLEWLNAEKQPERKEGEWIDYSEDGFVECPFCHSATNCEGNKDELHYCFSCGSYLDGLASIKPDSYCSFAERRTDD